MTPEIPPHGYEIKNGPLIGSHFEPRDLLYFNEYAGWQQAGHSHTKDLFSLRIDSPIHALNFPKPMTHRPQDLPSELPEPHAPPEGMMWVYSGYLYKSESRKYRAWLRDGEIHWHSGANSRASENPCHYLEAVPIEQAKPEPAKAREWTDGLLAPTGSTIALKMLGQPDHYKDWTPIHVREILPETSSPESAEVDWKAISHELAQNIRDVFNGDAPYIIVKEYLNTHFPDPVVAFDWDKLWGMLPPWTEAIACEPRGDKFFWFALSGSKLSGEWFFPTDTSWSAAFKSVIPPEFAPPAAPDWKLSLQQRPTV